MAQKPNFAKKALGFLQQNPEQEFTAQEIADWIFETYPDECRQKLERTSVDNDTALLGQIAAEISPRLQDNPKIKTTEGRPRGFYFTESADSAEIDQAEISETSPASKTKEHDLYPILSEFLWSELKIYSKRINEKRSANSQGSGGNKHLYPDLVGVEVLISDDWHPAIKECVRIYPVKKAKLWSFEVKKDIYRRNVREVFFQAVSNSSWANFGYLVASKLTGRDTLKELRMLASLHGIGFIQLNAKIPSESQIMIPAKERSEIDWDTANRLTQENKDFLNYIELISQFYHTRGKIRQSDWDVRVEGD